MWKRQKEKNKMHMIIRIICYGKDEKEAREQAEIILEDNLVGGDKSFDYGTFFDDETAGASGKARWGNLTSVALADSKEGKKLIDEGMKFTKEEFKRNLQKVKEIIDSYSEDELFEGEVTDIKSKILEKLDGKKDIDLTMFKYYCSCLGEYRGSNIFLYDNDGEGIRSERHLKDVLNKWNRKDYEGLNIYVVPVDVHH